MADVFGKGRQHPGKIILGGGIGGVVIVQ